MDGELLNTSVFSFQQSLQSLLNGVAVFVPKLVVAFIAFIILWVVAVALGKLVEQVVRSIKVDSLLQGLGAEEAIERAGFKLNSGGFLGGLVRWFFIVVAFLVAVDILGLAEVSGFLSSVVLTYIPKVIIATIMIIVAALLGEAGQKVVRGSAQAAGMPSAHLAGAVAKWAIWVFGLLAAFYQVNIVPELINTILTAIVAMLAIAGGLAFGLGGKDAAHDVIDRLRRETKGH